MSNKWISVEKEFLSNLIDNTRMLQGEWRWKENSSKSNNRDMKAIADDIEKGDKLLKEDNLNKEPISEDENSELSAAKELLLQAKYQLEAIDNQFPTKGTKTIIQEIENFLK